MPRCQGCGREAPTKYVEYYQNIGMLVMRQLKSIKGNLCRQCSKKYFLKLTGLTLVTGWWGMISFIMNPFLIINNTVRYVSCMGLGNGEPSAAGPIKVTAGNATLPVAAAPSGLASYRHDIVMRLRGGQTSQEIAAYVAPRAGVSVQAAQSYAESLRGSV